MNQTPTNETPELHLFLLESAIDTRERSRWRRSEAISLLAHFAFLVLWVLLPADWFTPSRPERPIGDTRSAVPLIAPRFEITQTQPTKGPIVKEIDVEGLKANLHAPAPPAPSQRPRPTLLAPSLPSPPPLIDAPRIANITIAPEPAPLGTMNSLPPAPPPQIQPQEAPKLRFETPGSSAGVSGQQGVSLTRVPPPAQRYGRRSHPDRGARRIQRNDNRRSRRGSRVSVAGHDGSHARPEWQQPGTPERSAGRRFSALPDSGPRRSASQLAGHHSPECPHGPQGEGTHPVRDQPGWEGP